jgi:hypothetical protein
MGLMINPYNGEDHRAGIRDAQRAKAIATSTEVREMALFLTLNDEFSWYAVGFRSEAGYDRRDLFS